MIKKKIVRSIKDHKLVLLSKLKKIGVLWFPIIENIEDYHREIARVVWYLFPIKDRIKTIYVVVDELLLNQKFELPLYASPEINNLYLLLKDKIVMVPKENFNLKKTEKDIVVIWKDYNQSYRCIKKNNKFIYTVNADLFENQFESNQILKISRTLLGSKDIQKNNQVLCTVLQELKNKYQNQKIFLLGSGPSVKNIYHYDMQNSCTIICNSLVRNEKLLKYIRPKAIVATDAVFHSGYSKYAYEFRNSLIKAMMAYKDMIYIVPLRDLLVYRENLPKNLSNRIFGIESRQIDQFNFCLLGNCYVKATSNVLTAFMLPLATTISRQILLCGFDGREVTDSECFWKYDQTSQFLSAIDHTKYAHPAFYKVDYQKYYMKHCQEVEAMITKMIHRKYEVINIGKSNIPALRNCQQEF